MSVLDCAHTGVSPPRSRFSKYFSAYLFIPYATQCNIRFPYASLGGICYNRSCCFLCCAILSFIALTSLLESPWTWPHIRDSQMVHNIQYLVFDYGVFFVCVPLVLKFGFLVEGRLRGMERGNSCQCCC